MKRYLVLITLVAVCMLVIALQNAVQIKLNFLFWSFSGSLALILLAAVVVGIVAGVFIMLPDVMKKRKQA